MPWPAWQQGAGTQGWAQVRMVWEARFGPQAVCPPSPSPRSAPSAHASTPPTGLRVRPGRPRALRQLVVLLEAVPVTAVPHLCKGGGTYAVGGSEGQGTRTAAIDGGQARARRRPRRQRLWRRRRRRRTSVRPADTATPPSGSRMTCGSAGDEGEQIEHLRTAMDPALLTIAVRPAFMAAF